MAKMRLAVGERGGHHERFDWDSEVLPAIRALYGETPPPDILAMAALPEIEAYILAQRAARAREAA